MEHLLLLLGTGSSEPEKFGKREYRTATYFLADALEASPIDMVETPFVGEAILRLYPGRFNRVHLLGTVDSMWDTLYEHTLPDDYTEEQGDRYFSLHETVDAGTLSDNAGSLRWVEDRFSEHVGVETTCHLLPPGSREEEFWDMLETMTNLNARNGTVSLDITHGLRAQPVFLLLSLFYLRSVYEDVRMGSVFYGAYELANSYFDGQAPIYDLRPMVELMDWIEAAQVFDRYGDATPIAELLREASHTSRNKPTLDRLAQQVEAVSQMLQVNVLTSLSDNLNRFNTLLSMANRPLMLDLIRPRLRRLPRALEDADEDWKALLRLGRRHWDHYQAGLAVLTAYEAVIARMAKAYGYDATDATVHRMLGHAASDYSWNLIEKVYRPGDLEPFPRHVNELREMRNSIAHVERAGNDMSPQQVYGRFPHILRFLETYLGSPFLDQLPQHRELKNP